MTDLAPSMLESALWYLSMGWNVIPVTEDKRPQLPSWEEYQRRMVTEREVREWWSTWPNAGIAVITGSVSGLVVVDVDSPAGMEHIKPYLNGDTLTTITGGGGRHFYFKHPGQPVPNAVGLLPGVDLRGDGGYVIVPPSTHKSGNRYRWEYPERVPSLPPPGLLSIIRSRNAGRKLDGREWDMDIPEGGRDAELTRRAGRLLQVGMSAAECLSVMEAVNRDHCKPPLQAAQVEKIVLSIAGREAAKPGREPRRAADQFTVMTQREMLRRYGENEDRWTVDEWLPEASCGLIVAPPGSYKTWMLSALAFSVASGRPFLGRYPVTDRGPVLFIQQEDPWWMLQSRLGRMFNPSAPVETGSGNTLAYELDCSYTKEFDELPVYWYTDRQLNFNDKAILSMMGRKISEIKPKLVMIDPLYTAADTRDYMAEGAQKMVALKAMRDTHGCSFIIAHHTTVAGSASEDRSSIWGSQFLNAWLEFGWRMPKGDDKGNVVIRHFKSCENPKRIRLKFDITDWGFAVDVDENCAASVSDRIEEAIAGGLSGSMRSIADAVGCSVAAVHKAMKKVGQEKGRGGAYKLSAE
jgi:hypothetical protein